MAEEYAVGDVVQLLSTPDDGPSMTVQCTFQLSEEGKTVYCLWQRTDGYVGGQNIPVECLKRKKQS